MSYPTTPPRVQFAGSLRDQLAALQESPNASVIQAESRARDRAYRDFQAAHGSPSDELRLASGRGLEAGAIDLHSLFGASGRSFDRGSGIPGRPLEMNEEEASRGAFAGGGAAAPFQALSQTSGVSAR